MAIYPYQTVNWTQGPISTDKLQRMADNDQWLFENSAKMVYQGPVTKSGGLRIAAGKIGYPATDRDWMETTVYFGGFFSVGCIPAVVCTAQMAAVGSRKLVTIKGIGSGDPDYRGFIAQVSNQENYPNANRTLATGWVHWIAVGW